MTDFQNNTIEKEDISIKELLYIILRHSKLFLGIMSIFFICSILYLIIVKPLYLSEGKIIIDTNSTQLETIFSLDQAESKLDNEIEILKSRTTAERTITSLFNKDIKDGLYLFNTKEYEQSMIKTFFRKIFLIDRLYNGKSKLLDLSNEVDFNSTVKELRQNVKVSNVRNTDVLNISYTSLDPIEAALVVNTLISEYQKRDLEWATGEMTHLKQFLNEQLSIKETELSTIEVNLKDFQEKENIYKLDDQSEILLTQLFDIESQYYKLLTEINIIDERKVFYEEQLNQDELSFADKISNTMNSKLLSLRQELAVLEAEYTLTKARESDKHPAVIEIINKINSLKSTLKIETEKYVNQEVTVENPIQFRQGLMDTIISLNGARKSFEIRSKELKGLMKVYDNELSSLPSKFLEFSRLQRDKIILDQTYGLMKQKLEESKINEASKLGKVRVVDSAEPPLKNISPNKKIIILGGLFLGLFVGFIVCVLYEYFDNTIKSIEDIERRGFSVLAIIPSIGKVKNRNNKNTKSLSNLSLDTNKLERRLLTHEDPKSPISEAYRSLRTSLTYLSSSNKKMSTVLVSSAGPGEGKTTTVANLAITYANMGKKTLLIDTDLRKPVVHKIFGINNKVGISHYLSSNEDSLDKLINKTSIENLKVITSGVIPPNPSELLGSKRMKLLINSLNDSNDWDIVLFDTSPLIAVTDAVVLSQNVDNFILVVRSGITIKPAFERVISNLEHVDTKVNGIVFNAVDSSTSYGAGYYYNYYQYYYGSDDK